jgi:hypothetical protein
MSSALPSRDSDSLIREDGVVLLNSSRSGHEAGWFALDLKHSKTSAWRGNRSLTKEEYRKRAFEMTPGLRSSY